MHSNNIMNFAFGNDNEVPDGQFVILIVARHECMYHCHRFVPVETLNFIVDNKAVVFSISRTTRTYLSWRFSSSLCKSLTAFLQKIHVFDIVRGWFNKFCQEVIHLLNDSFQVLAISACPFLVISQCYFHQKLFIFVLQYRNILSTLLAKAAFRWRAALYLSLQNFCRVLMIGCQITEHWSNKHEIHFLGTYQYQSISCMWYSHCNFHQKLFLTTYWALAKAALDGGQITLQP